MEETAKISFSGRIVSIQPRSTVWRYIESNRTVRITGYNIFLAGTADGEEKEFCVALSEQQLRKLDLRIGDLLQGNARTKQYPEREFADYYRASALKVPERNPDRAESMRPPFTGEIPPAKEYQALDCRMLDKTRWKKKCFSCRWAGMSNVTVQTSFEPPRVKRRFETFCFGPYSCPYHTKGRARAVPFKGMSGMKDDGDLDCDACGSRLGENRDEYWDQEYFQAFGTKPKVR